MNLDALMVERWTLLRPGTATLRLPGRGICYAASGTGEGKALETTRLVAAITRKRPEFNSLGSW